MQDDGAGVTLLRDKVDGGTRDLYPVFQSLLVDMEAIAAHSAEGGDEGGVDIDDGVGVGLEQLLREDGHKAGHDHQIGPYRLPQQAGQGGSVAAAVGEVPPGEHIAGDAGVLGTLQGEGVRSGGDDGGDPAIHQLSPPLGVDQGLQIGPAAGDQDGDTFGHSEPPSELGIRKLGIKNLEWMECAWGARFEIGPAEPETQFPTPHFSFLM